MVRHERTFHPASWAIGWLLGLGLTFLTAQAADAATLRLGQDCGPTIQD